MIAILTDPAVGGTFLTWSLHYLTGHKKYFSAKDSNNVGIVDLPVDPVTKINAHNFVPNHPITVSEFDRIFTELKCQPTDTFHVLYMHNFIHSINSHDAELKSAIDQIAEHTKKIIVLSASPATSRYHVAYNSRAGTSNLWKQPNQVTADPHETFRDFVDYFFKDSKAIWDALQLSNIWDQREFVALNFNFDKTVHIAPNIDPAIDYYHIDIMDLFNTFDTTIKHLLEYLDLPIIPARLQSWAYTYSKWKKLHYNRLQFTWYFDDIINAILTGKNTDLVGFNLDLVQEAAIQNHLIYKHNLNFKTWQLEKFINTQQLHSLLEPNLHDLSKQKINDSV